MPAPQPMKGSSSSHCDAYCAVGLTYPPDLQKYPAAFRNTVYQLPMAAIETAVFGEETDPYPKSFGVPQFADVNLPIYKCSDGVFKAHCPTLCTKSLLLVRMQLSETEKIWRFIRGERLLRLIWFFTAAADLDEGLCRVLVGSAFSGFSFAAVGLGVIAGTGASC
eukprot:5371771-Pyramimonas_sp.AAC.1